MIGITPLWPNRHEAGLALAQRLHDWRDHPQAWVIGLPRGGIVVAAAVAQQLRLPLHSWAVRKLAHPAAPELAVGALAPGGVLLWQEPDQRQCRLDPQLRRQLVQEQDQELHRRQRLYGDPPVAQLRDRPLLVVDDGVATGLTVRAALASLRQAAPRRVLLAVPVIDQRLAAQLRAQGQELVALAEVNNLFAVGAWYERFEPVPDSEVLALMAAGRQDPASSAAAAHRRGSTARS